MLRWLVCQLAPRLPPLHDLPAPELPDPDSAAELADRGRAALAASAAVPFQPQARYRPCQLLLGMGCKDLVTREADQHPETAGRTPNYASHPAFAPVEIPGHDGFVLRGHHSLGAPGAPAVFVLHGLNDSHVSHYVVEHAERFRRWGFHVFALDLRGHGLARSSKPASLGAYEGKDLFAAASTICDKEGVSVGIVGLSYGGQCAVRAAHEATLAGRPDVLRGGVVSVSSPLNVHEAVLALDDIDRLPRQEKFFDRMMMKELLSMIRQQMRLRCVEERPDERPCHSQEDYIQKRVLPAYPEQPKLGGAFMGAARSAQASVMGTLTVPTLVLQAEDDPLVPVRHAREAEQAAGSNPLVGVRIVPRGGHVALGWEDPAGYFGMLGAFFGRLRDG